uniref:Uncharacterized protein n=1 Tax=Cacopsylla melanoneura TaxID=428564 RepID=A0A8D8PZ70_9HEMI
MMFDKCAPCFTNPPRRLTTKLLRYGYYYYYYYSGTMKKSLLLPYSNAYYLGVLWVIQIQTNSFKKKAAKTQSASSFKFLNPVLATILGLENHSRFSSSKTF